MSGQTTWIPSSYQPIHPCIIYIRETTAEEQTPLPSESQFRFLALRLCSIPTHKLSHINHQIIQTYILYQGPALVSFQQISLPGIPPHRSKSNYFASPLLLHHPSIRTQPQLEAAYLLSFSSSPSEKLLFRLVLSLGLHGLLAPT